MARNLEQVVPFPYVIHQGLPMSTVAENGFLEYFYPTQGVDNKTLEFRVEGNADHLIHPFQTYIRIKGQIIGSASAAATSSQAAKTFSTGANVSVVNNFLSSLFDCVEVELNNVKITKSDRNYPYISYLENLLNYGTEAKKSTMRLQGWANDNYEHMDTIGNQNEGWKNRKGFFNDKDGQIELIGKIASPLFNQSKMLTTMVTMRITLHKRRSEFYMLSEEGDFSFKIQEAVLMVQKVLVIPAIRDAYLKLQSEGKPGLLHLTHGEINRISINKNMSQETIDNLFLGKIPQRVMIGMVSTRAFLGQRDLNPFNFKHFDVAEMCLYKDGSAYPRPSIKLNIEDGKWVEAYHHFLTSIKARYNRNVPGLNAEEYKKGFTLFTWDMSPDQLGSTLPGTALNMNSNVRLEVRFHNPLPENITLLVYYELPGLVEIHKDRQVSVDWMN